MIMENKDEVTASYIPFKIEYDTRLELCKKVLVFYNAYLQSTGKSFMREKQMELMAYYMCYGYSDETTDRYTYVNNISAAYTSVLKSYLKRDGFIENVINVKKRTKLNDDLEVIRRYFIEDNRDITWFAVVFGRANE